MAAATRSPSRSRSAAGNIDAILDFAVGTDKIALDDAIFTGVGRPANIMPRRS